MGDSLLVHINTTAVSRRPIYYEVMRHTLSLFRGALLPISPVAYVIPWFWNVKFGNYDKIILSGLLFLKKYGSFFSVGVEDHFKDTIAPTVE